MFQDVKFILFIIYIFGIIHRRTEHTGSGTVLLSAHFNLHCQIFHLFTKCTIIFCALYFVLLRYSLLYFKQYTKFYVIHNKETNKLKLNVVKTLLVYYIIVLVNIIYYERNIINNQSLKLYYSCYLI